MSIILFDKDGVIVDSEQTYLKRTQDYLKYLGYNVDDQQIKSLAGGNNKIYYRYYHQWFEDFDDEKYENCKNEYFKNVEPVNFNNIKMKNMDETLKILKNKGHHMSLVSSATIKSIDNLVDLYGIRNYFDYLISGEDFHESKPNPEIYLFAKNKYKNINEKIYVVEDSELGIEAAKGAGLTVIAKRDNRFNYDQSKADYFIDDLLEIIDIVD